MNTIGKVRSVIDLATRSKRQHSNGKWINTALRDIDYGRRIRVTRYSPRQQPDTRYRYREKSNEYHVVCEFETKIFAT